MTPGRLTVSLIASASLLFACGGPGPVDKAVSDTERRLDEIRSGTLTLTALATPGTAGVPPVDAPLSELRGAGFRLEGPFRVGEREGSLPVADLRFTRITGAGRATTRFISTGSEAFIEADGSPRRRLTDAEATGLRVQGDDGPVGLEGLSLRKWFGEATIDPGPQVDGVATTRVSGPVDAVAVINDLLELAGGLGRESDEEPAQLRDEAADRVRAAAGGTRGEIVTGADDRFLRHLDAVIDLDVRDPRVSQALGELAGARLTFVLEVRQVNQSVEVRAPGA